MRAPAGLVDAIARLRDETLANPRLAALLMLVPLVLVIHVGLLTRDALEDARTDRSPLARRAARLEALAASGGWTEAIGREEATLARWQSQAWRASSADLAAADLQTTLRAVIAKHLAWNRMKLAPAVELKAVGGWRVSAEVNGRLREEGALPMLQELAEHSPRIIVEQLLVSAQRGQTITMQLSVVVLPEDEP